MTTAKLRGLTGCAVLLQRGAGAPHKVTAVVDALHEVEGLVAFEGRGPATDAERRAAGHLVGRLEDLGRNAETESIRVFPNYALTHLIHALLAIVGSVVSVTAPLVGTLLVLVAGISTALDL